MLANTAFLNLGVIDKVIIIESRLHAFRLKIFRQLKCGSLHAKENKGIDIFY